MSTFFRKLKSSKEKWLLEPNDLPWLNFEKDVHADLLSDLTTSGNSLSIYEIEEDKSNLDHVIAAIASSRDNLANVDYAVFDGNIIKNLNIQLDPTIGTTPDTEVNNLHRDLKNLTASNLSGLAKEMRKRGQFNRKAPKGVIKLIKKGLDEGRIDKTKIKESLMKKL